MFMNFNISKVNDTMPLNTKNWVEWSIIVLNVSSIWVSLIKKSFASDWNK